MEMENDKVLLKAKDFASEAEVKWCPGCGDYSVLKQVQEVLAQSGIPQEKIVFVSGIGCSSRFPYYMNTYGIHSLHGRPLPFAIGLKAARPDLEIWVVTGDGDCLSIGGNHFLHALRRNPNLNVLLFNNQIYALTKGQLSPTSEMSKVTKSSPLGGLDQPLNPLALAIAAGGTFAARVMDRDPRHLREILQRGRAHSGTSFIEIYQNCNIFNDGTFENYTEKELKPSNSIFLEQGKALLFGNDEKKGIRLVNGQPVVTEISEGDSGLWIHDECDEYKAFVLSRFETTCTDENGKMLPRPFGVLFKKERRVYEELVRSQMETVKSKKGKVDFDRLLEGRQSWEVKEVLSD